METKRLNKAQLILPLSVGVAVTAVIVGVLFCYSVERQADMLAQRDSMNEEYLHQLRATLAVVQHQVMNDVVSFDKDYGLDSFITNTRSLNLGETQPLQDKLLEIKNTNKYIHSIGVYYEKNNRMVYADEGVVNVSSPNQNELTVWHNQSPERVATIPIRATSSSENGKLEMLASICVKLPTNYSQNFYGSMIVNISYDTIKKEISEQLMTIPNRKLILADTQGTIVFSSNTDLLGENIGELRPAGKLLRQPNATFSSEILDDEGWRYRMIEDGAELQRAIDEVKAQYRSIGLMLILFIVLPATFCICRLLHHRQCDMLQFTDKLSLQSDLCREGVLLSLLMRKQSKEEAEHRMQAAAIELPSRGLMVAVVECRADREQALNEDLLLGSLEPQLSQCCYTIQLSKRCSVIVGPLSALSIDALEQRWSTMLLTEGFTDVAIGIYDQSADIETLGKAYQQAHDAVQHHAMSGSNRVVRTSRIVPTGSSYRYPDKEESQLIAILKTGDRGRAQVFMRRMLRDVVQRDFLPDITLFCHRLYGALASLCREVAEEAGEELIELPDPLPLELPSNTSEVDEYFRDAVQIIAGYYLDNLGTPQMRSYFQTIMRYIERNYTQDVTVEQVCEHAGLSPTYVNKVLKTYTDKSLIQHLNELRIQRACELLATTDRKVMEIAESVGFSSSKYFIKIFREQKEMTPGEYRQMQNMTERA